MAMTDVTSVACVCVQQYLYALFFFTLDQSVCVAYTRQYGSGFRYKQETAKRRGWWIDCDLGSPLVTKLTNNPLMLVCICSGE